MRFALDHAAYLTRRHFNALDGLRGAAIALVLLAHVNPSNLPLISALQHNGSFGVSLFFVISGYLICTLFLREEGETGRISLPKFYARRALRLLPLYYALLALECVMVFGLHLYSKDNQLLFRANLPSYVLYFNNWLETSAQGPFFCAWSLAVEEQFYLGFGLLMFFAPRRWLIAGLAGALGAKFAVYSALGEVDHWSTAWRIAFSYNEAILWGVLLAFALRHRAIYARVAPPLAAPGVVGAIAIAVWLWLSLHPFSSRSRWDAQVVFGLMTLLVGAVVVRRSTPLLSGARWMHLGQISYGIYLLHPLVFNSVQKLSRFLPPILVTIVSVAAAISLASLVYQYFEAPIIAYYKQRFSPTAPASGDRALAPAITSAPLISPETCVESTSPVPDTGTQARALT